jgi:hypothetical protein
MGLKAGQVHVSLVQTEGLYIWRVVPQDSEEPFRGFSIPVEVTWQEDALGAEALGGGEGHTGLESVGPGFVRGTGHHPALSRPASHSNRTAKEAWVESPLHRHKEGIKVNVQNSAGHDKLL